MALLTNKARMARKDWRAGDRVNVPRHGAGRVTDVYTIHGQGMFVTVKLDAFPFATPSEYHASEVEA